MIRLRDSSAHRNRDCDAWGGAEFLSSVALALTDGPAGAAGVFTGTWAELRAA